MADFWRKYPPAGEMLGDVEYMGVRYRASAHPGFTNVVSVVTRISIDKIVYENDLMENGWRPML